MNQASFLITNVSINCLDRETVLRNQDQNAPTLEETHVIKNEGVQDRFFTEEHWSSEIKSFITTSPPKFVQIIKAYKILATDRLTLIVEVRSDPPAIFEWFCNDRPVTQDSSRYLVRHAANATTLTINEPEQGVYACSARNPGIIVPTKSNQYLAGVSKSYGYVTVQGKSVNIR